MFATQTRYRSSTCRRGSISSCVALSISSAIFGAAAQHCAPPHLDFHFRTSPQRRGSRCNCLRANYLRFCTPRACRSREGSSVSFYRSCRCQWPLVLPRSVASAACREKAGSLTKLASSSSTWRFGFQVHLSSQRQLLCSARR